MTHICVSKITIIGSDNGLSPGRRQAIIWTSVGILLIGPLGTNFSEILIEIYTFSFAKRHLKISSGKWRPFCLGLNVLIIYVTPVPHSLWGTRPVTSRHFLYNRNSDMGLILWNVIYIICWQTQRDVVTWQIWQMSFPYANTTIAVKFCTWHDNCTVPVQRFVEIWSPRMK